MRDRVLIRSGSTSRGQRRLLRRRQLLPLVPAQTLGPAVTMVEFVKHEDERKAYTVTHQFELGLLA